MTMEIGVRIRITDSSSASKPKVMVPHRDATYLIRARTRNGAVEWSR